MTATYYPIQEKPDFDASEYAQRIEKALKGDKKDVAKLIVAINNAQRQEVKAPYQIRYGKKLTDALKEKLSGDTKALILALVQTPIEYDIEQIDKAIEGAGTDENTLIEIICSRTPFQLKAITEHYNKKHANKPLAKAIESDTSGEFKDLLIKLVGGSRDTEYATDDHAAYEDAIRLYADGKCKLKGNKDGSHFLRILASQNMYQLRKVFAEFKKLSHADIETAIKQEFSGDLQKAYLTIVGATTNKQKFFAKQLFDSMKGLGTDENTLIRVIVSRSEVDLNLIREEYRCLKDNTKKETLQAAIEDDTSGVFRDTLLDIIAGNKQ